MQGKNVYRFILPFLYRWCGLVLATWVSILVPTLVYGAQSIEDGPAIESSYIRYFHEQHDSELSYADALENIKTQGQHSQSDILNFGLGSAPVWISFELHNAKATALRYLQIENSWLDKISVFFLHQGQLVQQTETGDSLPYDAQRSNRFFSFPHEFMQGATTVLIRIESDDPQVLPLFLYTPQEFTDRQVESGYTYGIIYGFLIALLIYNALLFFSLKSRRYLYYSFYLTSFIFLNAAYTGHGYQWLWSDWPQVQNTIIPVLMIMFALSGLVFASMFLALPSRFPRLDKSFNIFSFVLAVCLILFLLLDNLLCLLYTAFIGVVPFAVLMIIAGSVACFQGVKEAPYFLGAAVFAVISAVITAFTVSGLVEYNSLGFHAVEYGILLEAVLFALALAYQFRISQDEKVLAQRLADRDQLTGLYNRRGFNKLMKPIFSNAIRNNRNLCLMILDIDYFKKINDEHGHAHGDIVLLDLARALSKELRAGDLVARWGGEEFLLLLPETKHAEAIAIAERLVTTFSNHEVTTNQHTTQYTVSIGISELKRGNANFSDLLGSADHYLYQAKENGRNRVCYRVD
ncbi:MAG: hypothetical protein CMI05_14195 [Oceanospirillaceae bacterium]|nr:hypothetical protein [Oceanospirillaceae bacterium]